MDTSVILNLYCQRPGNTAHVPFGQWFCLATGTRDHELWYAKLDKAKHIILEKKYNELPDLEHHLNEYNLQLVEH